METRIQQAKIFLLELGISYSNVENLFNCWAEPHRYYHNTDHLLDLLLKIDKLDCSSTEREALYLIALYHDSVYNPTYTNKNHHMAGYNLNELESTKKFCRETYGTKISLNTSKIVVEAIWDTGKRTPSTNSNISSIFWNLDNEILYGSLSELIEYENKISKEFQFVNWNDYVEGRVKFLQGEVSKNPVNIECLIQYIKSRKPSIGIYAGSFNPFHTGHLDILNKANRIFDKVIILRGKNLEKTGELKPLPKGLQFFECVEFDGLTTEFMKIVQSYAKVTLIRGIRDESDLHGEITQLRYMEDMMPNFNSIFIHASPETTHISSSGIRI